MSQKQSQVVRVKAYEVPNKLGFACRQTVKRFFHKRLNTGSGSADNIIMNIQRFFLILPVIVFSFFNCKADYFDFSSKLGGTAGGSSSASRQEDTALIYCNKFNAQGFSGVLTAYYDPEKEGFNTNKAQLFLWNIPYEFEYPATNYIQVHAFYIANNKKVFKKNPVSMELVKSASSQKVSLVTTVGHDLLEDLGEKANELIQNYHFILKDMDGWHGVTFSVFDKHNKPVKSLQALIPPFTAHPSAFFRKHNQERLLSELHPFKTISSGHEKENNKIFYDKGVDFCKDSPVKFDIPPLAEEPEEQDPLDQLIQDLSLILPDL